MRFWAGLALLGLVLAGCASVAPPVDPQAASISSADALVARLPESVENFRRGGTTVLSEPAPGGREVAYATGNRGIAGFVQVIRRPEPMVAAQAEAELQRFVSETTSGTAMHRRLRARATPALPAENPVLRCVELDGIFGRQSVESLACVGAFGGQLVRLRLSHIRREGRMAEARGFAEAVAAALR